MPPFLQGFLRLTDDQKNKLEAAEKDAAEKLGKVLTDDQRSRSADKPLGWASAAARQADVCRAPGPAQADGRSGTATRRRAERRRRQARLAPEGRPEEALKQMQEMAKGFQGGPPGGPPGSRASPAWGRAAEAACSAPCVTPRTSLG